MKILNIYETASSDGYKTIGNGNYFASKSVAASMAEKISKDVGSDVITHKAVRVEGKVPKYYILRSDSPIELYNPNEAEDKIREDALAKLTDACPLERALIKTKRQIKDDIPVLPKEEIEALLKDIAGDDLEKLLMPDLGSDYKYCGTCYKQETICKQKARYHVDRMGDGQHDIWGCHVSKDDRIKELEAKMKNFNDSMIARFKTIDNMPELVAYHYQEFKQILGEK